MTTKKYDLSIVLNAHREANKMQSTLRSLCASIEFARSKGIKIELVIVLDTPDSDTKLYLRSNLKTLFSSIPYTLHEVAFGDLGLSRNYGVEKSSGEVIGTVDADDLFGERLIYRSYQTLIESKSEVVVHPEIMLSFDAYHTIWKPVASNSAAFNPADIAGYNPWPSVSFARKSVRSRYPYIATHVGEGFGPEDWQWNADTLGGGVHHIIAPETVYYYRRKREGSLERAHAHNRSLLKPTVMLQSMEPGISGGQAETPKGEAWAGQGVLSSGKRWLKQQIKKNEPLHRLTVETRKVLNAVLIKEASAHVSTATPSLNFPDWLLNDWEKQNEYEHKLYPDPAILDGVLLYEPQYETFIRVYWELLASIKNKGSDYVFLVPWIGKGGADLVTVNYLKTISHLKPQAKIAVILTENRPELSIEGQLPDNVAVVRAPAAFYTLSMDEQLRLFATLLIQIQTKRIHVINSTHGYLLYSHYGKSLSHSAKLFMWLFGPDRLPNNRRTHILLDDPGMARYISKIFTDNEAAIHDFMRWSGFRRELFSVHYTPISDVEQPKLKKQNSTLRILWAGRLDRQKRPDILLQIAEETEKRNLPFEFDCFGSAVLGGDDYLEAVQNSQSVRYKGEYSNGLRSLDLGAYDVFLLTSDFEGLPNTIVEAISSNLLVVTPDVGGIGELISKKTGFLIEDNKDIAQYIEVLTQIHQSSPEERLQIQKSAYQKVKKNHSDAAFIKTLKQEDGYID